VLVLAYSADRRRARWLQFLFPIGTCAGAGVYESLKGVMRSSGVSGSPFRRSVFGAARATKDLARFRKEGIQIPFPQRDVHFFVEKSEEAAKVVVEQPGEKRNGN
jgi:hypothetical protein